MYTAIQYFRAIPWLNILCLCTDDWTQAGQSFLFGVFKMMRTKFLQRRSWGEFTGTRKGPHPPFRRKTEIWECHPPLPLSISRLTGTSICSYVIQFFGRCSCPPFCASLCGSGTRFSPVSRTSSGMWRSRCASVWRGTCWRWTLAPAPKVVYSWRLCACACCSEVCRCCFLWKWDKLSATVIPCKHVALCTESDVNRSWFSESLLTDGDAVELSRVWDRVRSLVNPRSVTEADAVGWVLPR